MSSQQPPNLSSTNWDIEDDDMFEDCEEEGMIEDLVTVAMLREVEQNLRPEKRPFHTSPLTGKAYMEDLKKAHPRRFFREFRMRQSTFKKIVWELENLYGWECSREDSVTCFESFAMFIWWLKGYNNPKIQERFQHSGETVSRHLHKILDCMVKFVDDKIKPTRRQDDTHPYLDRREMYKPFKGKCIGAIDGTHVMCKCSEEYQKTFFSRKGYTTQNIIAACDFDLTFVFASAGYDGSIHDYTIFRRTALNNECPFPHPEQGKFYLVDAGYPNMKGYLAPFKGFKYHQADFRRGKRRITCDQEYFNRAHSSLRSVIERTFGIWKARWGMLKNMPNVSLDDQVSMVLASMAIHNYIRRDGEGDLIFSRIESEPNYVFEDIADLYPGMLDDDEDANPQPQDEDSDFYMAKVRHDIMKALRKNRKR